MAYGAFIGIQMILHMTAFRWIPNVPYVISAKRVGAMVGTIAIGLFLANFGKRKERYAEEKKDVLWRSTGVSLMLFGMVLVIAFGK